MRKGAIVTVIDREVKLDVEPLSGSIGAVIRGVDLRDLDEATVAAIREVWLERKVVFFPGQHLDPDSIISPSPVVSARPPRAIRSFPGFPGTRTSSRSTTPRPASSTPRTATSSTRRQGIDWHTDVTFVKRPPLGSILNAKVIPPSGGDTMWSDQGAALERPESVTAGLPRRRCTRCTTVATRSRTRWSEFGKAKWEGKQFEELEPVAHPVVRTHPETGERVLFVNPGFTSHIVELDRRESDALLEFLYEHSVRPEFVVRYHWTAGDIGFWDNRSTQHAVVGDFGTQHRLIQRVTLKGDQPA